MAERASSSGQTAKLADDAINVGPIFHVANLRTLRTKSTWKTYNDLTIIRYMRKTVPELLNEFWKRSGLSLEQIAQAGGWKAASGIQRYLSVGFRQPYLRRDLAERFARAFVGHGAPPIAETEVLALAGPGSGSQAPLINMVQAGKWREISANDVEPEIWVNTSRVVSQSAFALTVSGKSMAPEYSDGDIIIIEPDLEPQPGDDVIAKLESENEATFKRFGKKAANQIDLVAVNELYESYKLDAETPGIIVGVVVEHHRFRRP